MKNLELQNYGVATLSTREMRDTNGGVWFVYTAIALSVVALAVGFYNGYKTAESQDCN